MSSISASEGRTPSCPSTPPSLPIKSALAPSSQTQPTRRAYTDIMKPAKQYLIDVRTPTEYLTGPLQDAINIEYQNIAQLPDLLSSQGQTLLKSDAVTLYCRSGRRSGIALQTLKSLGYENVRDIGGLEEARAVLKREEALRGAPVAEKREEEEVAIKSDLRAQERKHGRAKSFSKLLEDLKSLE